MQMQSKELSRVPRTLTEKKNGDLISAFSQLGNSLFIDLLVFVSNVQMKDLFSGGVSFTIEEFARSMGHNRTNLQRKMSDEQKQQIFGALEPPVVELSSPYNAPHSHSIESVFEAAIWKMAKENLMFRHTTKDKRTTYRSVQIIESFDIYYDYTTNKKTRRLYTVNLNPKLKETLVNNYNLICMPDYVKIPDRAGWRLFYLNLCQMIVVIKYRMQQGESGTFTMTVDDLCKAFNVECKDAKNKKTKVKSILDKIRKHLSYTSFDYEFIKNGQRYAYTVSFSFPPATLEYFNEKMRAIFTAKLYQNCESLFIHFKFGHITDPIERRKQYSQKVYDTELDTEFVEWFSSPENMKEKGRIYESTFIDVFSKTPEEAGIPKGSYPL